jgi:hypothetical protein
MCWAKKSIQRQQTQPKKESGENETCYKAEIAFLANANHYSIARYV